MSVNKKYRVARHGKELGTFSLSEISNALQSGHMTVSDDCWTEGDSKWRKLSDITSRSNTSSFHNPTPLPLNFSKPMQNQSNPPVIPSNNNHSWALVALFISSLCILITLLFFKFRNTF